MLLPSSIVPLSIGMGRVTACALRGCRALSLRSPFSPSNPGRKHFHPPTHRLLCNRLPGSPTRPTDCFANRLPGTRPFPRRRWRDAVCEDPFQPSFQACLYVPPQGGLGGFQLRASTSTAYLKIRWVWRARWASKGSCLAYPFTFCGAKQRQGHAVTPSLKQGLPAHALLFCQFFDEVPELWEDEFFHREADGVF